MSKSKIGYLDYVWNPYTWACEKVSPGCKHCYAETRAERFGQSFRGIPRWRDNAYAALKAIPTGQIVGVNFMSDTYHVGVPLDTLKRVHEAIAARSDCQFVITTKRSARLREVALALAWPDNLWIGVSIETPAYLNRLDDLRTVLTGRRWVSFEPLLAEFPNPINLNGIAWVVTGGESGTEHRRMNPEWAWSVIRQARAAGIPVYHKQASGQYPDRNRELYGRVYDGLPFLKINSDQLRMF